MNKMDKLLASQVKGKNKKTQISNDITKLTYHMQKEFLKFKGT